jgi:hypothetical protein
MMDMKLFRGGEKTRWIHVNVIHYESTGFINCIAIALYFAARTATVYASQVAFVVNCQRCGTN